MKYTLETSKAVGKKGTIGAGVKRFMPLMAPESRLVVVALIAMLISTGAALVTSIAYLKGTSPAIFPCRNRPNTS